MDTRLLALCLALAGATLPACATTAPSPSSPSAPPPVASLHRDGDDLLTAGLGAAGLQSPLPPAFADATAPTATELRRRAIWSNWRGIADLTPDGGFGRVYGSFATVPGREFHALSTLPGHAQPHRLLLQLPDAFDPARRCVVVAASSGSRGIYGAIALAGAWGLPRGCAVAYTDKGAGTGYVDTADGSGAALDGRRATDAPLEFTLPKHAGVGLAPLAVKHAHSGDNPEAHWGAHVLDAAAFALRVLEQTHPDAGPWTAANTRVLAVGVSNGGGAVLRAAEADEGLLDAVVAISPNILPGEGGRALYDYATEAALLMPCALNASAFDRELLARPGGQKHPLGSLRCASLAEAGLLSPGQPEATAEQAYRRLHEAGWSDAAISAGALSTGFDLWRAVAVTYASAYARSGVDAMPCGYRFAAMGADGLPRAPTAAEKAAWWSDASGIPPGAGVGIVDTLAQGSDPHLPGLRCLRALWDDASGAVRAGIAATRAGLPRMGLPVLLLHGNDDGLIPAAFSAAPYARWAQTAGREVRYWPIANAQHFDAFLGLPPLSARYLPLLPYAYRALDAAWAHLAEGKALPAAGDIANQPRGFDGNGAIPPLTGSHLGDGP